MGQDLAAVHAPLQEVTTAGLKASTAQRPDTRPRVHARGEAGRSVRWQPEAWGLLSRRTPQHPFMGRAWGLGCDSKSLAVLAMVSWDSTDRGATPSLADPWRNMGKSGMWGSVGGQGSVLGPRLPPSTRLVDALETRRGWGKVVR